MKNIITFMIIFMTATAYRLMASEPQAHIRSCVFRVYSPADSLAKARFQKEIDHYRRLRNGGIALTAIGGAAFVTGDILLIDVLSNLNTISYEKEMALKWSGYPCAIGGVFALFAGIFITIANDKLYKEARAIHSTKKFDGLIIE